MRTNQKSLNSSLYPNPSFSVHRNGTDQLNITGVDKVEWTTESFDTHDDFDSATNYRFTPTVQGKYLLSANIAITNTQANDVINIFIYKNGSEAHRSSGSDGSDQVDPNYVSASITAVVDANGISDYFEIFAENDSRDTSDLLGEATHTYWTGCRLG